MFKLSEIADNETVLEGNLDACIADVTRYDVLSGLHSKENSVRAENVLYHAMRLAGSAGKIAAIAADLWKYNRHEQIKEIKTQIANTLIALCRLALSLDIDINEIWVERFKDMKKGVEHPRVIQLKEVDEVNGKTTTATSDAVRTTVHSNKVENSTRSAARLYASK